MRSLADAEALPAPSSPAGAVLTAVALALALALTACSSPTAPDAPILNAGPNGNEALFFTLNATPDANMEALFEGRVLLGADGCLRLESSEAPTVIWPVGFSLQEREGELLVRDAEDRAVGRIGGHFRLGGGTVPELNERMALDEDVLQRADARCPGRYWIVGEIAGSRGSAARSG